MTRYVGLDVHKRFIEVCILDASGKVVFRGKADLSSRGSGTLRQGATQAQ